MEGSRSRTTLKMTSDDFKPWGKPIPLSSAHLFTADPCVPGTSSCSLLPPCKPRVCRPALLHCCPHSGCLCGDEVTATYRGELVHPSTLIWDGLFPQSSCCNNIYFVQQPRERARARASEHEPTPFQNAPDKSGTPGSNQNTELWNKLTFRSPHREGEFSRDTSVHNHNKNSFSWEDTLC